MVYLICFDTPFHHARHYLGSADDVNERLRLHRAGQGARLLYHVALAGIQFDVVRTWDGGRVLERQLKQRKCGPLLCPRCRRAALARRRWRQLSWL